MFERKLNIKTLFIAVITIICVPQSTLCQEFGYDGKLGPEYWSEHSRACGGKFQSPINIDILEVIDRGYTPLIMHGFNVTPIKAEVENNGHTVIARFTYKDEETPTIHGGSLGSNGIYKFSQFHFHWGNNDTVGSEDRINNVSFPAELHMVFFNLKHGTFTEALAHDYGIAVLAFFYEIQEKQNFNYAEFTFLLSEVREPHQTATFQYTAPTLKQLITDDIENYFTYTGSLTTPPCSENVIWIDFEKPIKISAEQHSYFIPSYEPIRPSNAFDIKGGTVIKSLDQSMFREPPSAIPFIYNSKTSLRINFELWILLLLIILPTEILFA